MSRGRLTTTSYAVLSFLAIKPWSSYELTQQMGRSLRRMWPRAESKLYEEPKKLVAHGLARSTQERVGRRARTTYAITAKGRRALRAWLQEPGEGPVLEFEQLLKIFFSENGTREDALRTLSAAGEWAHDRAEESAAIGRQYLEQEGPFPQRLPQQQLTARFLNDFYALVAEWARWGTTLVEDWPDDMRDVTVDRAVIEETVRRSEETAGRARTSRA